ncbi:hypothetical protein QTQ03_28700 [Micromonospora sp. WMMA1363]|uniref:hypothetical protein n=1 Tax=Micromonospora sp. WMMA1363 TaxID=3053985 RepID=UPI00259CDEF1|nr:hypothetical protein [Micromonospora sp. WMMA1363]MDM4723293.1 hypothetical protein [Micromonospora sp. WMMA1363]MDM4723387.1 hypothetical protein [Micromonospora sp. WMMA1363]
MTNRKPHSRLRVAGRSIAALVAGVVFAVNAAAPAHAKESDHAAALAAAEVALRSSAEKTGLKVKWDLLSTLTTEELKAIPDAVPTSVSVEVTSEKAVEKPVDVDRVSAASAATCKTNGATIYYWGGFTDVKLWRFTETVYYCYDYGKRTVTSIATPETTGYVYGPGQVEGWKYRGVRGVPNNIAHRDSFGISYYTSYVQASFELCTLRLSCIAESNPWIRLYSYRDGSVRADKGGIV